MFRPGKLGWAEAIPGRYVKAAAKTALMTIVHLIFRHPI
jgi:hypothetical protein